MLGEQITEGVTTQYLHYSPGHQSYVRRTLVDDVTLLI